MSIKKRIMSAVTAAVLAVTTVMGLGGCSSRVSYAMEIDGEKIPAGLYILYSGYAYQLAQQKLTEEQPDLKTTEEGFDWTAQKVSDMDFMDYVRQEALNSCKRYTAANKLFDELNIALEKDDKDSINDSVNSQWDYEIPEIASSNMSYLKGFSTIGEYYESIGVSKASLKLYVTASFKSSKIFDYYYGEGGVEEVSKEDKGKWIEENYALSRYFAISIKDSEGNVIESKTELALIKKMAEEYADKLNKGESYKDVYDEYVEYSKAQTSTAGSSTTPADTSVSDTTTAEQQGREAAPPEDTTTAAAEETEPEENVTTATTEETEPEEVTSPAEGTTEPEEATSDGTGSTDSDGTASTTAAETGGTTAEEKKDSDYDRIIKKDSTSPSEDFVKTLFEMKTGEAKVIEEDTAYYVVQRLDILKSDQDYAKTYDSNALYGLKGEEMDAVYEKKYADYAVAENGSAPDYCKQQAANASNGLNAISQIQYLLYYYSSMLGGGMS